MFTDESMHSGGSLSGITYGVASGHIKRSIEAGSSHPIDTAQVKRENVSPQKKKNVFGLIGKKMGC